MAISKIKVGNTEHEIKTTIANVEGLQTALDGKAATHSHPYVPLAGGTLNDGATLKLSTYGNRFVTISGNSITADMSKETGGWAGNFASVKDPSGATTSMLGWYGGASGLTHIYMGGTYSDPFLKFTPQGQFTFKNRPRVGTSDIALKSDIPTESSSSITVDSSLSSTSKNPVQNKVVKSALDGKLSKWSNIIDLTFSGNEDNSTPVKLVWTDDGSYKGGTINFPKKSGTVTLATLDDITLSSGGTTTSSEMPIISYTGTSYATGRPTMTAGNTIYLHIKVIGGGEFQVGDRLELCAMRTSYRSQKEINAGEIRHRLRALCFQDITESDIGSKTIRFDLRIDESRFNRLFFNDSNSDKKPASSMIHLRVRRPIYAPNGNEYNAKFSNLITLEKTYAYGYDAQTDEVINVLYIK